MSETKSQLNVKIEPKIHWLANRAARYQGLTLAEFIEATLKQALKPEAMLGDEPIPGHEPKRGSDSPLWNEALWSEDKATRSYYLMLSPDDLLSDSEKRMLVRISRQAAKDGRTLTLNTFTEYYNAFSESE